MAEKWLVDDLVPYENNAKNHPGDEIDRLVASIQNFGFRDPILIDEKGVIIAGHGRRLAAMKLGLKFVPVEIVADLDEEQRKKLRLAHNRVHGTAYDEIAIAHELSSLETLGGLENIFTEKEFATFDASLDTFDETALSENINKDVADLEAANKSGKAPDGRVNLDKVLGFKTVAAENEMTLARFIAWVEAETDKSGEEALVAYAEEKMAA